ncbi:MAG: polyribonucleotide nucleotidyltransferase [Sulfuricurvum sp.]
MKYDLELDIGGVKEEYSFTRVAKQTSGAAWLKCGDSVLLATVVADEGTMVEDDFLPLTVQYIEKSYAAGKIPGGFFKRETKPSDFETLTSRIVDRSLRPLFPKGYAYPTQITVMVFSADESADLQVLALKAASAALYVSDLDINQSVTPLRVTKGEDGLCYHSNHTHLANSKLDLYLSASKEDLLMIEMRSIASEEIDSELMLSLDPVAPIITKHSSNLLSEDELLSILDEASRELFAINRTYEEAFESFKKPIKPLKLSTHTTSSDLLDLIRSNYLDSVKSAINQMAKTERSLALQELRSTIIASNSSLDSSDVARALDEVKREVVREQILSDRLRADGRGLKEVRPITICTNVLPKAHASALFTRGQTQALVVLTLGNSKDAQMYENLTDEGSQNESFMFHYNFPPFSVGEAAPITGVKRRELGHGNLAKRALESIIGKGENTIRLVSEILESNGSSSMASVCGGYMALRSADIATSDTIAGVAMGLVSEGDRYAILSDIMGLEDHDGDMDFKVAGSKDGISAMQMDIKLGGVRLEILKEALMQAKSARSHIIDIMLEAEAEIVLNDGVLPTSEFFHIDPSFIGDIIGQAGKTIREIIERFEVLIDIDKKDGKVKVTGKSKEKIRAASEHIKSIANTPKVPKIDYRVGDRYSGVVKKIVEFGAFIELPDGTDGLIHISKLSNERVQKVSDILSEGESVTVEILEFKGNKISLALV